jgi:hypothetical protein
MTVNRPIQNIPTNMANTAIQFPLKAPSDTEKISTNKSTKLKFNPVKTLSILRSCKASFIFSNFIKKIKLSNKISGGDTLTSICYFKYFLNDSQLLEKRYPGYLFPAFPEKGILSYVKTKVIVAKDDKLLKTRMKMI